MLSKIVNGEDVGMIQRGDGFCFTLEPLAELSGGNFDGDIPAQTRVSGAIHFSHSTGANRREDFIRAELIAYGERHMGEPAKSIASKECRRNVSRGTRKPTGSAGANWHLLLRVSSSGYSPIFLLQWS